METKDGPQGGNEMQRRELAHSLDCLTDDELQVLADVKASTTEAWRKRGIGPKYLRFGTVFLYPRAGIAEHLEALVRERPEVPAKGML